MHAGDVELGHLAPPDAPPGPRPGVVVVHDVWGLSDHTRDLARRFAREGFAALADTATWYRNATTVADFTG